MKYLLSLVMFCGLAFAQEAIPSHPAPTYVGVAFVGFDSAANPKVSGGVLGGRLMNATDSQVPLYSTIEVTPGINGATNATAGVWARVWSNDKFFVALQGAAGAASYANAVGLALQTGGAFGYRPFTNKSFSLVFKPSAIKLNIGDSSTPGNLSVSPQFKFGVLWSFR